MLLLDKMVTMKSILTFSVRPDQKTENNCTLASRPCQRLDSAAGPALGTGPAFGHDKD